MCKLVISFTFAHSHPFFPDIMNSYCYLLPPAFLSHPFHFFVVQSFPLPLLPPSPLHSNSVMCCVTATFSPRSTSSVSVANIHQLAFLYTHQIAFFFFNQHCNPCGLWPAQLLLSILSRNIFTECHCQRHVKPPNLEDQ